MLAHQTLSLIIMQCTNAHAYRNNSLLMVNLVSLLIRNGSSLKPVHLILPRIVVTEQSVNNESSDECGNRETSVHIHDRWVADESDEGLAESGTECVGEEVE